MSGFVNHAVLLSPPYCAVPGILQFDYGHEGRAWVRIEVNCETDEIRYTSASGRSTEWHGEMRERHPFRPGLFFLQPDRSPRHQIMLLDFHSPYGFQHRLCLSQVSPFTWAGQHDVITTDRIVMTLIQPGYYAFADRARPVRALPDLMPAHDMLPRWHFGRGLVVADDFADDFADDQYAEPELVIHEGVADEEDEEPEPEYDIVN